MVCCPSLLHANSSCVRACVPVSLCLSTGCVRSLERRQKTSCGTEGSPASCLPSFPSSFQDAVASASTPKSAHTRKVRAAGRNWGGVGMLLQQSLFIYPRIQEQHTPNEWACANFHTRKAWRTSVWLQPHSSSESRTNYHLTNTTFPSAMQKV